MVSVLASGVQVQVLAGDIVLCSWAKHYTLTAPVAIYVYKQINPKCFFCLNKSLHLFEMHWAFLPLFNPNLDLFQTIICCTTKQVGGTGLFLV